MDNKIKVSQLPECTDLTGLYTLGVDGSNTSVKVGLEFLATASSDVAGAVADAEEAARAANEAAENAEKVASDIGTAVADAEKAVKDAEQAVSDAQSAVTAAQESASKAESAAASANSAAQAANDAAGRVETAIAGAESAAEAANEAAASAEEASSSANSAADSANAAAGRVSDLETQAEAAVNDATKAAEDARAAVETATEASVTAKGAADDAAAAVEKAEEAAKAANEAATSANDAASSATSAAESATEAATAAGSAAESATSAAASATEAAGTANAAAQDATEAAEEARQAAQGTLKYSPGEGIAISDDLVISCTIDPQSGEKGDKGDPGDAATVDVGTTTTGEAGTDAKVTNSGTTSAAVLDFVIPRGEKGEKGDTGDAGVASVSASGTAPLTLSGSLSGTALTITGSVANATASTAGVVKPYSVLSSSPTCNSVTTTSGRYYRISTNSSNVMIVNVPWTDTTYTQGDGISISSSNVISCTLDLSGYAKTSDLSDYAKTSDLSGYVTTSSLSSQLAGYLPLSGGTLTGDLKVEGTTTLNAAETGDLSSEAGVLVAGSGGAVRLVTLDALAEALGLGPAVAFKYNYTGSNAPSIKNTTSRVDGNVIFGFDGAVDVIVNGVRHDNVIAESGDTYAIPDLVTGENDIRIIPRDDGTRVYTKYWEDAANLAGTYITHIMDWGKWKYVNMNSAFNGPFDQTVTGGLRSVCADKWGAFSEVTSFQECFSYCPELQSVPSGLFASCPNVTDVRKCFYSCPNLQGDIWFYCDNVNNAVDCFNGSNAYAKNIHAHAGSTTYNSFYSAMGNATYNSSWNAYLVEI